MSGAAPVVDETMAGSCLEQPTAVNEETMAGSCLEQPQQ